MRRQGENVVESSASMRSIRIVVEQHPDGFVAYPLGLKGVVVGEGDTADEAINDVRSAINFHIETFGSESLEPEAEVIDAFLSETEVAG
jgi:predicted RNase H-like HicB family nuclease